jgi:hypothetical protein
LGFRGWVLGVGRGDWGKGEKRNTNFIPFKSDGIKERTQGFF